MIDQIGTCHICGRKIERPNRARVQVSFEYEKPVERVRLVGGVPMKAMKKETCQRSSSSFVCLDCARSFAESANLPVPEVV